MKNVMTTAVGNLDMLPSICLATDSPIDAVIDYLDRIIVATKSKITKYGTTSIYLDQELRWQHELIVYQHIQEVITKIMVINSGRYIG